MANLETTYMGLKLRNPVIVASSGLTNSIDNLKEFEAHGAGAIVLKSIFEEDINHEMKIDMKKMNKPGTVYPEMYDMFDFDDMEDSVSRYLELIRKAKEELKIPVIASVNCTTADEWTNFVGRLERAGADAIELNMFVFPSYPGRSSHESDQIYFDVIDKVKKEVSVPIALKISHYFSNLGDMIVRLSETDISALVLFNRFYSPDIDVDKMEVKPSHIYSSASDIAMSLRWVGMTAERVACDLSATTGVHSAEDVVKQLLAGATTIQIASALYVNGKDYLRKIVSGLGDWMDKHNFKTIEEFRGKLSQSKADNPAVWERAQFMKHFAGRVSY